MGKIIGVFGLSGVGKSKFSDEICALRNDFVCTRASEVIKAYGGVVNFDFLSEYTVPSNQKSLVHGFKEYKRSNPHRNIIIELHNIIETKNSILKIEDNVFEGLSLDAACFLYSDPELILLNRVNDKKRKRSIVTSEYLGELQKESISIFENCFYHLGIPYIILDKEYHKRFFCFLKKSFD